MLRKFAGAGFRHMSIRMLIRVPHKQTPPVIKADVVKFNYKSFNLVRTDAQLRCRT